MTQEYALTLHQLQFTRSFETAPLARWIGLPEHLGRQWRTQGGPAPMLRKQFICTGHTKALWLCISGLGYYELYINGKRVSDAVLEPVPTQYDRRTLYRFYDVSDLLRQGKNVLGVILGNGWYNCHTPNDWQLQNAPWKDAPKMILQLGNHLGSYLTSDNSWKVGFGPIVCDSLRNGETYDARLENNDWLLPAFDDSQWHSAEHVAPPGGILQRQKMPPCKVMQTLPAKQDWPITGGRVYDLEQNITGWARICVCGQRGSTVTIRYGERLHSDGRIDQEHISKHVVAPDNFQTDRYILRGDGVESWEPRFTYHGFRYIEITTEAGVIVEKVEGRLVHTAFGQAGEFLCSDTTINRLQECTRWSYINNFTGIPTDCPQREKNGWTGDAHLAAETGLYNYTAASSYAQWMESLCDAQRPSGQVPAIIPTGGWGFNRFSGPAWDSALFLIPWYIYLHTGDQHPILAHYDAMRRYIDYCAQRADGNIISFGLGDWNHFDPERIIDTSLTSTAFYHTNVQLLSRFAQIAGREDDQIYYRQMAHSIRKAFTKTFYRGNGIYLDGQQTGLGAALVNDLVPDGQHNAVTQALAQTVEANGYRPDFGILGAKWVPRALAENGHALTAYRLITQPDFPGWVNWLRQGATTLWESWWGRSSLNHIMFGDISAWFYRYLAGIRPDPQVPGFKHIIIKPETIAPLNWVQASHTCAHGVIESHWQRSGQRITLSVSIPAECRATVYLPCGKRETVGAGKHSFQSASLTAEPSRNNTGHITEETACHTPPVQEMAEAPYRNRI